jgi:hypothetical protein
MDGLYNAGGTRIAYSPDGTAGRFVGREIDFQAVYTHSKQMQLAGGYAHIFPGEFLKRTTPGKQYGFSYVMAGYTF